MNLNRRLLYIGLSLIFLTVAISFGFTYYTKLKSPVFLRNCLEVPIPNQNDLPNSQILFELNYITYSKDTKNVTGINFPEAPGMAFSVASNSYQTSFFQQAYSVPQGIDYGRYSMRTVYVFLDSFSERDWYGEKELHEAKIQFSDSSFITADLGRIILFRDRYYEASDTADIIRQSGSSSSDGSSSISLEFGNKIILQRISSELLEEVKDIIEFKIEGEDYREFSYEDFDCAGMLTITSQFEMHHKNKDNYDIFDIKPKLYYLTKDNEQRYTRIYLIPQKKRFYTQLNILLYLIDREAF